MGNIAAPASADDEARQLEEALKMSLVCASLGEPGSNSSGPSSSTALNANSTGASSENVLEAESHTTGHAIPVDPDDEMRLTRNAVSLSLGNRVPNAFGL